MDWGEAMRAAALMGVTPEAFWRLSVREWRMLTGPAGVAAPMSRRELEAMTKAWPDRTGEVIND